MVFWTIAEEIRSRHTLLLVWVCEDKESCPFEDKGPCTETAKRLEAPKTGASNFLSHLKATKKSKYVFLHH